SAEGYESETVACRGSARRGPKRRHFSSGFIRASSRQRQMLQDCPAYSSSEKRVGDAHRLDFTAEQKLQGTSGRRRSCWRRKRCPAQALAVLADYLLGAPALE